MKLREANIKDLDLLNQWDTNQHVIDSDPNDDWNWETELNRNPEWREQLMAEVDGRPIGFIQIIDPALEETKYWGECENDLRAIDIWIGDESDLGRGYGTTMMNLALERCFKDPKVKAVIIDPLYDNSRARVFYERLGFRFVEKRQFGLDECAVYRLDRHSWEERK